jgi:hypothetical protein
MKSGNVLYSAVQFVFAVLIILLGGLFIGLQYAPHLRFAIADFFSQSTVHFSLIGYLILGCGFLLLIGFYAMHRGVYYQLNMGQKEAWIDPLVIRGHVKEYWKKIFPDYDLSVQIGLSKEQKIEMFLELPPLPEERQLATLEQAEKELGAILKKQLRYEKEFTLSVLIK